MHGQQTIVFDVTVGLHVCFSHHNIAICSGNKPLGWRGLLCHGQLKVKQLKLLPRVKLVSS